MNGIAVEIVLANSNRDVNKSAYDYLYAHKDVIEAKLGIELNWWRYDKGKASYLDYHIKGIDMEYETRWVEMAEFHAEWSKKFYDVIVPILREWDLLRRKDSCGRCKGPCRSDGSKVHCRVFHVISHIGRNRNRQTVN